MITQQNETLEAVMKSIKLAKEHGSKAPNGLDITLPDEWAAWLENYLAQKSNAGHPDEDTLALVDELYDVVSAPWIARSLSMKLIDLRTVLGKVETQKCEGLLGRKCKNDVEVFYYRIKGGYSKKRRRCRGVECPELCQECAEEYAEIRRRKRAERKERWQREEARRNEKRLAEYWLQQKAIQQQQELFAQIPSGVETSEWKNFLAGRSELVAMLHAAAAVLLFETVDVNVMATTVGQGWPVADALAHELPDFIFEHRGKIRASCDHCHGISELGLYAIDLRKLNFRTLKKQSYDYLPKMGTKPALMILAEFGSKHFSAYLANEWVKGRVFGNSNVTVLCSECAKKTSAISPEEDFYKISEKR